MMFIYFVEDTHIPHLTDHWTTRTVVATDEDIARILACESGGDNTTEPADLMVTYLGVAGNALKGGVVQTEDARMEGLDDAIDLWHNSPDDHRPLHEALGMSVSEYNKFFVNGGPKRPRAEPSSEKKHVWTQDSGGVVCRNCGAEPGSATCRRRCPQRIR